MKISGLYSTHIKGQALVLLLAFISASIAVLYALYNISQITTSKQILINAVDSSAMAGAGEQARLLNFIAYGNRSMIAADVMSAQIVSLNSWLKWLKQSSLNASKYTKITPYIQIISGALSLFHGIASTTEAGLESSLPPFFLSMEALKNQIHFTNQAILQSGGIISNNSAINIINLSKIQNLAGHSDAEHQTEKRINVIFSLANEEAWRNFTQFYSGNRRNRIAEVISASRDEFSIRRDGNILTNWNVGIARSVKKGVTILRNFDRWEAQDTWDIRIRRPFRSSVSFPIGWGRVDAGKEGNLMIGNEYIHHLAFNSRSEHSWSGISSHVDISSNETDKRLSFIQAASIPENLSNIKKNPLTENNKLPTTNGGRKQNSGILSQQISAISAAEVYFERPQRGSNDWTADSWRNNGTLFRQDYSKEYSSLFNPFWQAKLRSVAAEEKSAVLNALGVPSLLPWIK